MRERHGVGSATAGAAGLLVLVLIAGAAPWLPVAAPYATNLDARLRTPSVDEPLGRDSLGRDVLARMVHGARISLAVGLCTVAVSLTLGVLLGALAGYLGGWTDELISRTVDVLLAFPGILLAVALAAIMGPTLPNVVIALSVLGWTGYARLTRTQVMTLRQRDFVAAARVLGVGPVRIVWRHILPLAAPLLLVQATFGLSGAILAEAALSFLGLGVPPPLPSWGAMLDEGRMFMLVAPHLVLAPGLALAVTVLALQLLGDGLRDVLDFGDVRTPQRWHREQ